MKRTLIFFCLLLSVTLLVGLQHDKAWTKALDKNGVQVFLHECNGCQTKEFKAQIVINVPMEKVFNLLLSFKDIPKYIYANRGTFLLEKKSPDEYIYYTIIKSPKPVEDRDLVVDFKIMEHTAQRCYIKTSTIPDFVSENPGYIRVKVFTGSWELIKLSDNQTKVITASYSEPGGKVPAWIINTFIVTGPYSTLVKMRQILDPGSKPVPD